MTEQEFKKWMEDAKIMLMLTGIYSATEVEYIVDWFYTIKTSKEVDLLGDEDFASEVFSVLNDLNTEGLKCGEWLYLSLSARLFMYAPYIYKRMIKEKL